MPITIKQVSDPAPRSAAARRAGWPEAARPARDDSYARHLLHRDRNNRFVVLALVWRPGQGTPIHDHSCWGVMGVL
jgi:predicted metal-dependent enzyme (double-stranded beta helix superfamily)